MSARPRLTVDLDALAANHAKLRDLVAPADVAAVVKADGYGLGLAPVARTLFAAGARHFFVADAEEGLALRPILPDATVYVLGGYAHGSEAGFQGTGLRPVLNSLDQAQRFAAAGGGACAVQVDTGMTRLGMEPSDLATLPAGLAIDWLMSHLASADENPVASERQRERFEAARALLPGVKASLANSAGTFLGKAYHCDLDRPGIAIYGGNPTPGHPNPMAPVVELDAVIVQIHALATPAQVGYGATYPAAPGSRIATAAIGYADGLLRCLGNRATALVAGVEVPFAGRVSMDLVGLDVTAVPAAAVAPGDRGTLIWGPDGIDRMAALAETIPYEVLVRLGPRIERHYVGGPAA
ncbi:MAG: alanine racemase [Geminicoccaceae bacterium]|nr:MAG: alanine racemase [Geminicoccaceae bacterium]